MGLFDDVANLVKGAIGQAVQGRLQEHLPSAFSDALNNTPLSGLQDQLPSVLEHLQNGGLREQVQSWLEQGSNMHVSADQIVSAIGQERIESIASQLGVPPEQASELLAKYLPKAVDEGARQAEQQGEAVQP